MPNKLGSASNVRAIWERWARRVSSFHHSSKFCSNQHGPSTPYTPLCSPPVMRRVLRRSARGAEAFGKRCHTRFEPVSARNTACSIYENSLFYRTTAGHWEHDANGRPLKDVHDAGALFRAAQYDPTGTFRPLQILIGCASCMPFR